MTFTNLHYPGYEGTVEEQVPVEEFHRASCNLCDWKSEEFGSLDWREAEEAAVEHYEFEHGDEEDDEEEDEDDD